MLDRVKQADCHILSGAFLIARQRELISELEERGIAEIAERGRKLLATFEELQAMRVAVRDRLKGELLDA